MFVGMARLELHLPEVTTLKEKRAIVQSVAARLRNQFHIAVAELDRLDNHQIAVMGLAAVSNEAHHAQELLDTAIRYIESSRPDAELTSIEVDVLPAF